MIKGFIFDMDGVITETTQIHYEAWRDEVKKLGIKHTKKENVLLKGISRINTLKQILKMHNKLSDFSKKELNEIAASKNRVYLKKLNAQVNEKNILPGIKNFLKIAKKAEIQMAIASSSLNALLILKKTKLLKYFKYITNPKSVKNGKPAPNLYLKACKGLGLKPHEVIGFEDAILGIEGLKKANIKTVAITWGNENDWSLADFVLKSTKDLNLKTILKH